MDPRTVDADAAIAQLAAPERRPDLVDKVIGRTRFAADRPAATALVGAVLTSPIPHGLIRSVDVSRARAIPGVVAVLTGDDLRGHRFGRRLLDRPVLCWDRVLFVGDRIAAVAAETAEAARAAIDAIAVDLEPLPAILSIDDAERPGAPVLHEDAATYRYFGGERPPVPHPNLQGRVLIEARADELEAAFRAAATVVEGTYTTPRHHGAYLEPHATLVEPLPDGGVRIVSTNKAPFSLREQIAAALGLEPATIVVDSAAIGGDFGAKGYSIDEFVAVALVRAAGRPVRMVMSMEDELAATSVRHAARIHLRTALDADGRIVAHAADVRMDGGAYAGAKPIPTLVPGGSASSLIAYHIPVLRIDARVVYTNTVPAGHVRAPGEVQALFAGESHVDELARAAGMDPLAFRELNAVRPGRTGGSGSEFAEPRAVEVLAGIRAHRRLPERSAGRGWGMSITARHVGAGGTLRLSALMSPDGTFEVITGLVDQGGGAHTVIRRVLAAALGIDDARVTVTFVTTDGTTPDRGVGASRTTHLASRAALALAGEIRSWVEERQDPEGPVRFDADTIGRIVSDEPIRFTAAYDSEAGHSHAAHHHDFAACAVAVSVDVETGVVTIDDALVVVDVGTIVNPTSHRGQLVGGFAFGLSQATMEELVLEAGTVVTRDLLTYRIARASDVPRIRIVELPTRIGPGAFGAKMAGELTNAVVAPALANAIADAVGIRLESLPITPVAIRRALRAPA